MPVIAFMVDVTNEQGALSKDHGVMIHAGTVIEYEELPENVERLIKLGVAAVAVDEIPADAELPDDLEELKELADSHGIEYAANIGAKKLKEKIQKHLNE